MKYLRLFENFKECDYFDMKSIYDHVEFDKPLYSIVAKRKTAKLHYMSPKKYLETIATKFKLSYDETINSVAVNKDAYKKYAQMMKNGNKFPVVFFNRYNGLQEGRHRALAAMELGCEKMPVIEFIDLRKENFEDYIEKFKDLSFDEVNKTFVDLGFKGITMLGYNDLQNYFKYFI